MAKASKAGPSGTIRAPLSRESVLRAAVRLADDGGLTALTMRRLAQELGVEAMTLYYHVANKSEILNGIVDSVMSEVELPPAEGDWKSAMRRSAISAHEALLRHPWASGVMTSSGVSPARLRYMESILGRLRRAGFSAEMTHLAYHAIESHIEGFALWEAGFAALPQSLDDLAATVLRELSVDEYPFLIEHIGQHLKPPGAEDVDAFEFGLDLILDGLERIRDGLLTP